MRFQALGYLALCSFLLSCSHQVKMSETRHLSTEKSYGFEQGVVVYPRLSPTTISRLAPGWVRDVLTWNGYSSSHTRIGGYAYSLSDVAMGIGDSEATAKELAALELLAKNGGGALYTEHFSQEVSTTTQSTSTEVSHTIRALYIVPELAVATLTYHMTLLDSWRWDQKFYAIYDLPQNYLEQAIADAKYAEALRFYVLFVEGVGITQNGRTSWEWKLTSGLSPELLMSRVGGFSGMAFNYREETLHPTETQSGHDFGTIYVSFAPLPTLTFTPLTYTQSFDRYISNSQNTSAATTHEIPGMPNLSRYLALFVSVDSISSTLNTSIRSLDSRYQAEINQAREHHIRDVSRSHTSLSENALAQVFKTGKFSFSRDLLSSESPRTLVLANLDVNTLKEITETRYEGRHAQGEYFSVSNNRTGSRWQYRFLGNEVKLYTDDELNARFDTTCTTPIGPDAISGEFVVTGGYSSLGGPLCPLSPYRPAYRWCRPCHGRVTQLSLLYFGQLSPADISAQSTHTGIPDDVTRANMVNTWNEFHTLIKNKFD